VTSHAPPAHPARGNRVLRIYLGLVGIVLVGGFALAERRAGGGHAVLGVPFEFLPFAMTLLGVALLHARALEVALAGAATVALYKVSFAGFDFPAHVVHEWRILVNLLGLLVGFALLADHFERSHLPKRIPAVLPAGALGAFALLVLVWILSAFLDNIAAAIIGGVAAKAAFRGRISIAYVAAIVACANAGGAGSVIGDTTTTMMWIEGVPATMVMRAFLPALAALVVVGALASRAQVRLQPVVSDPSSEKASVDAGRLVVVGLVLAGTVAANVLLDFPAVGVWAALLVAIPLRAPRWSEIPGSLRGAFFLVSLVLAASMMPVEDLPSASARTAFGLGVVSSIFDNIPLTKLAIEQNGYDWALLAYAVGYGGSMTWFGSSAGVAITKEFPQARDLGRYLKEGWPVALAYVVGFAAYLLVFRWLPWTIPAHG
jgi:Na+/H+ antiporter NhaD/arsenite permease-like protein